MHEVHNFYTVNVELWTLDTVLLGQNEIIGYNMVGSEKQIA